MPYTYEYPRPALTVDAVVFGLDLEDDELELLLIQRDLEPFKGRWALPGGFVRMEETVDAAVRRELREETGLENVFLEQLYTFGEVDRDPRGRVVSVAYYALVRLSDHRVWAATDAASAAWFAITDLPKLAFDHEAIVDAALRRLRGKVRYQPIGFELLPAKFTLTQLQKMYEIILERPLDKRNFRKKILGMGDGPGGAGGGGGLLVDLNEVQQDVAHRAARLYRFDEKKYQALEKRGFNFEI